MTDRTNPPDKAGNDFAEQADEAQRGIVGEFIEFLATNKRWWLTPIVVALLFLGLIIILGGTAAGPFIYTLF